MQSLLATYIPLCEAIARLHTPHVEVVLHDLRRNKIKHIANCFSKRQVGDSSLTDLAEIDRAAAVIGPYLKTNYDGRQLKSISSIIRNARGAPIGVLCINLDVDALSHLVQQLTGIVTVGAAVPREASLFSGDWRERINETVGTFLAEAHATLAGLTKQQLDALVMHLDAAGLFEVRNATPYIADILNVSRATMYNWLKRLRAHTAPT